MHADQRYEHYGNRGHWSRSNDPSSSFFLVRVIAPVFLLTYLTYPYVTLTFGLMGNYVAFHSYGYTTNWIIKDKFFLFI